ncbi:hypothetical protein ATO8_05136 [Roseivivax marinus]|uniref:Uncharacterized protein n=1 Tax=Roseivivax marinus TaxID=1379903 RepID=W4HMR6_9RHOB|nr:hypothetical protein [Roseivivax marinus]ETW13386.1 hypothetical protein ATO8_05136 [Roseivivax marinus]
MADDNINPDPEGSKPTEVAPPRRRKRRKKVAYDPSSERARRIKEKHERDLAMEVARQEDSARKRRAVMAELLEAWLDEVDDASAGTFLLDLTEYASASEEKLIATHPRFPGNA